MDLSYIKCWRVRSTLPGEISRKNESGFTMLEILASVAILSITIIPLLGLFTTAPLLHAQREQQTRAAFLAQLRLEEVKHEITVDFEADKYDDGVPQTTDGKYGEGGYTKSTGSATDFPTPDFPASDANFRYTISETPYDLNADDVDDIKEITVKVWYDENGDLADNEGEQSVELSTKTARRRQGTA